MPRADARPRVVPPLLTFLVVTGVAAPLLEAAQGAAGLGVDLVRLTMFATAVGAAVVWAVWPHTRTAADVRRTDTGRALGLAFVLAAVAVAVLLVLDLVEGDRWTVLDPSTLPAPLVVVLVVQVVAAAAEEVGWRGVVQPLLERRLSLLVSGVVTGLLFGLGHVYVLVGGGPAVYATFVLSTVGISVLLAVLTTGRTLVARMLVGTAFHWLVNVAILVLFSDGDTSLLWTANLAAAFVGAALLALVLRRRSAGQPTRQFTRG